MVIRDTEEIIFFITPGQDTYSVGQDEVCLWTNSKELVHAFTAVFDDLWQNSTDIGEKILELETGKPAPKTCVIKDATTARRTYEQTLRLAREEILTLTSAKGLMEQSEKAALIREWANRGVAVKIMAPITSENLDAALQLSRYCAVRHASASHLGTTIIDGQHLFQFKTSLAHEKKPASPHFEDTFYTSDRGYVEKTRNLLDNIWINAPVPSKATLEDILGSKPVVPSITQESAGVEIVRKEQWYGAVDVTVGKKPLGSEKELLNRASEYQKDSSRVVAIGSTGQAIIRPPAHQCLPNMMIDCWHARKESTFGEGNTLIVSLWLKTTKGYTFVPVAVVETSTDLKILDFDRAIFAGTPAGLNVIHVTNEDLQVRRQGEGSFAGWTIQIPLHPLPSCLPPSCLLFEKIGEERTQKYSTPLPSGYLGTCEYTGFDAFVTFMSPTWKYAGPATEAVFGMNVILTSIAPQNAEKPES